MSKEKNSPSTSPAFLLFLLLLGLKLSGNIDWSWWYVTMPLWFDPAVAIIITLVAIIRKVFKKR